MKNKFNSESLRPFINFEGLKGDETVERKQYVSEIKVLPDEEMTCIARISTTNVDADGDIIDPSGCDLSRFNKNPVIHADHSYKVEDVIGKATELSIDSNGITAKIKFANCTQRAKDAWELVKGGYVKANSIGFIAKEGVIKGTKEFQDYVKGVGYSVSDECRRIITKFELIESSIVSVPCNPMALMQAISAKSINLSEETICALDLNKAIKESVRESKEEVKVEIVEEKILPISDKESKEEVKVENKPEEEHKEIKEIKEEKEQKEQKEVVDNALQKDHKVENKAIMSYIRVIRHGDIDIKQEALKIKALRQGKIL